MKCPFHFRFAMILLLLIAMAQGAPAQQTADAPPSLSQLSCQQIAVIGAVQRPSRLDAPLPLRLLEVLVRVGGPNERAGKTISVIHSCKCSPCDKLDTKAGNVSEYNLVDVLHGRENGNPFVVPGDIVMVPEADSVYVIGNVWKPESFIFVPGMTVTRAIALVGGVGRGSKLVVLRIHRNSAEGIRKDPIIVSLKAILEGHAENVLLRPWDIIEVSDDQGQFRPSKPLPPTWDPPLTPRKDTSAL